MTLIARDKGSVIFNGLNSFWKRFFADSVVLDRLYSATESLLGDLYLDLMEAVLSKSLRGVPVFAKRDWKLLVLSNSNLSFDPAIYSFAETSVIGPRITVTAVDLSSERDANAFELSDSFNLTPVKRIIYPTYGIYNVGIVTDNPSSEKAWAAVVPTGKSVYESIRALNRRIITNKRVTDFSIEKQNSIEDLPYALRNSLQLLGTWDAATDSPAIPPASNLNAGYYYEVGTAGSTEIDGEDTWLVGDRIISTGTVWVRAPLENPIFYFRYDNEISEPVEILTGAYSTLEGVRQAFEDAIDVANTSMAAPMNITVTIDGGYILLTSDKDFLIWDANTAAQNQLFLRACRFKFEASIPPGQENDFAWQQEQAVQMLTSGFREAGDEFRFPVATELKGARHIYNTLYKPSMALEEGIHYRIQDGFIYFQSNPFDLTNIAYRDYGDGRREIALWMSKISLDKLTLWLNFGYRFTALKESSEAYKDLIRGIYYFYTHGPQVERLRSAFNLLAGIPVVAENDELVLSISVDGLTVVTDKNTYLLPPSAPAVVQVGEVLQAFDALTDAFRVQDYINSPDWYDGFLIPEFLMPGSPASVRLSESSIDIPTIGESGFIIGDTDNTAVTLTTNPIEPALDDFSLTQDAFFTIERDDNGKVFNVVVPEILTAGAASLDAMIAYLRIAMRQILGNPVAGAGVTIFRLLSDAKFTIRHPDVTAEVTVTVADTSAVTTLAGLAAVIQTKVDAALSADKIQVFPYLTDNAIILMPTTNVGISLSDLNVSATSELGLFAFESLAGLVVSNVSPSIQFASTTVGSTSKVRISGMNLTALNELHMEPFRVGSGDFIGIDGDPSPGWEIMDKFLKYNTFKISFNAGAITFDPKVISIQQIVLTGRPLYTAPLLSPEFTLFDTIEGSDEEVDDVTEFLGETDDDAVILADVRARKKVTVYHSEPAGQVYRKDPTDPYVYLELPDMHAEALIPGVTTSGGELFFESTEANFNAINHIIELVDIDNIKEVDAALFSNVGVHNRGKTIDGVQVPVTLIPSSEFGGIYSAAVFGDLTHGHWVDGFDKADFPSAATHVFVIDDEMKSGGLDPFNAGVVAGNFITLNNFSDGMNNGEFAIMKYYRNVHFRNEYDGMDKVLVDIIAYRNNRFTETLSENYVDSTIPPAATTAFRAGGTTVNNTWLVVFPASGLLQDQVDAVLDAVEDDKDIFPFDITYLPSLGDGNIWNPPTAGEYYQAISTTGDTVNEAYYGEHFNLAYPVVFHYPTDPDAQPINPTPSASVPPGTVPDYHTVDISSISVVVGNTYGVETYEYDEDEVGQASRDPDDLTNPYLLGQDAAGNDVYVEYDEATKLDQEGFVKFGEVAFLVGIQYHFSDQTPSSTADYYGPHLTQDVDPISTGPIVWPPGDTSTYRSYTWKGYWIAKYDLLGVYDDSDPGIAVIGGGSPPNTPAPPGYVIGTFDSLWTQQIGYALTVVPGSSLPPATGNENDAYTVLLRSDTPHAGVNAPVEAGYQLFENLDWLYSDGTMWQRQRHVGSQAESIVFAIGKRITDLVNTGIHVSDVFAGLIGGGYILCHSVDHPYRIGTDDSLWTRVIGGRVRGDLSLGGWYDHLTPNRMAGYGPGILTDHSVVTTLAYSLNSNVFDWSTDPNFPGPTPPIFRVYEPGGLSFFLYMQVPESALHAEGVTVCLADGVTLANNIDAIKLHYFDATILSWGTPTDAYIDGTAVTDSSFTLKMTDLGFGDRRLRLWNANNPSMYRDVLFDAESGTIDDFLFTHKYNGQVVIALEINYDGSYGVLTDYLRGVVIERSRLAIQAA